MPTRTETDSLGAVEVPADAYWGAQTQRSIENFPFAPRERMPIEIIHALAVIKGAAAAVNRATGLTPDWPTPSKPLPLRSPPAHMTTSSR
jgi:fumarate hydratase class II